MIRSPSHLPRPPGPAEPHTLRADGATLALLEQLTAEHGEIICVHSADRKDLSYVLHDPAHIRQVLVSNHTNYAKGVGFERVKMLLGNGIIVSDGEDWRRQRTMIQPGFSRSNIAAMAEVMRSHTLELRQEWEVLARERRTIDVTVAMSHFGLQIILRSIFSSDLPRLEAEFGGNPFGFLAADATRDLRTVVRMRELGALVIACITRRRESGERPADFLSHLMDARDKKTGAGMSDAEIVDEVKTLIVAGHETSAGTLNWAWHLLGQHPDCEARLLAELTRLPEDFDFDALMALEYTPQVLKETLRLYPPVWLFSRRALADDQLGPWTIPAGAHIFISPYLVHRRPHLWPDPEAFRPERFTAAAEEARDRTAFIPFSAGARRCIGEYFSYAEMQMHLALLAPRFQLRAADTSPIELDPAVNLRTRHGIQMTVAPRPLEVAA
jgi:enediyne biosynthesis protein E7